MVKNLPAKTGDAREASSVPGSGRSSGGGNATHSSPFAWTVPWTEEPGRLQSMGLKETRLSTHMCGRWWHVVGGAEVKI